MGVLEEAMKEKAATELRLTQLAEFIEAKRKSDELEAKLFPAHNQAANAEFLAKNSITTAPTVEPQSMAEGHNFRAKITHVAHQYLAEHKYAKAKEIVSAAEKAGIVFGAKNKIVAVSQVLGKREEFTASRQHGWSLTTATEGSQSDAESDNAGDLI